MNDESYLSSVERACQELADGHIGYDEWAQRVIGEKMYGEENLRRCAQFFSKFMERLDEEEIKTLNDDNRAKTIERAKLELEKERKRLQTQNLELQRHIREDARLEMFYERVDEAIAKLEPMPFKLIPVHRNDTEKSGLLCVSDIHAGSTFTVKGMFGEVVNSYSMDIMKTRMWKLASMLVDDYLNTMTVDFDDLVIAFCGDLFENVLRMSSLYKLRDPVVDTVIETSEFLCEWVNAIAEKLQVPIKIVVIGGNHDNLAIMGQTPRPEEENLSKLAQKFMEYRFKDHPLVKIEPYGDVSFQIIRGTNILFDHGKDRNLKTTLDYFSNLYNIDIDEVYAGHLHHPESNAVGIAETGDQMVYRVGSIIGVDPYSKSIRKSARPSAYFALYDDKNGHTWSRNYYL